MATSRFINIPQVLIRMMNKDADRKLSVSLVAFAIALKMHSGTSTLTYATPYKIHKVFNCSLAKAGMLLDEASRCVLFRMNGMGHITAVNQKKLYWTEHNYEGEKQHKLMITKISVPQDIRLSAIEHELNRLSITMVINAADRRHELKMVGAKLQQETKDSRREQLSMNYISSQVGLSARQVARYIKDLVREKVICVYKGRKIRLGRAEETEGCHRTFVYNFDSFRQEPNSYQVSDWWERERHRNLIIEHKQRRKSCLQQTIWD